MCFNTNKDSPPHPPIQESIPLLPFMCFRVVTKGDYPELVRINVQRNVNTCLDAGLENFIVEVVADKSTSLVSSLHKREVIVPSHYQTRSGAMFKARALQYCLEDRVSNHNFGLRTNLM